MLVLTAVFDNLMIYVGLFDYGQHTLTGVRIGLAPIEDFFYPVCAVLFVSGLWWLLGADPQRAEHARPFIDMVRFVRLQQQRSERQEGDGSDEREPAAGGLGHLIPGVRGAEGRVADGPVWGHPILSSTPLRPAQRSR